MSHKISVTGEKKGINNPKLAAMLRRTVKAALSAEGVACDCEVNILLTDDEGIREVNRDMRDIDRATDVLSFPMFDLVPGEHPDETDADPDTGLVPLGDMCISVERAQAQAQEYGHSFDREICYLCVHSVLHLLGYDHLDEGEMKRQMRSREEEIMSTLKLER
ncbi:MAG: rRNA maturation RNase YbeY [Oscillospiraceae bacterium]|nr:rRNA maturation RNase YbeY [Oscillospiraceae bacterium]